MNKAAEKPIRKVVQGPIAQARILEAVDELFYKDGARAIGVDAVAKHAGVNKMSLYRQFESKDSLLLLYLERRAQRSWDNIEASLAKQPDAPRLKLLQFFSDVIVRAQQPGYRGCAFINIASEFSDRDHPSRKLVADHKQKVLAKLQDLATEAGATDPQALAYGLALLFEGACAASQTYPVGHPILAALHNVVTALVDAACTENHKTVIVAE
jgi:AcrR family transcriptional regulator